MWELLFSLSSSTFFSIGAGIIVIACMFLVVIPLMKRVSKLDEVVMEKLNGLPNSKQFEKYIEIVEKSNRENTIFAQTYSKLNTDIDELLEEVQRLNKEKFVKSVAGEFDVVCDMKMKSFIKEIDNLKKGITNYFLLIERTEDMTYTYLESLTEARIDTTQFLMTLASNLAKKDSNIIDERDIQELARIKEKLENAVKKVNELHKSNYFIDSTNKRSGEISRLHDHHHSW